MNILGGIYRMDIVQMGVLKKLLILLFYLIYFMVFALRARCDPHNLCASGR